MKLPANLRKLAIAVEIAAISLIGSGVVLEIIYRAHVYYVVITVGSLLAAAGGFIWAKVVKR